MSQFYSVAIDGPSGAGKSTMARQLAAELGFVYVDTGAIYRTVGYHMCMMGISGKDADGVRLLIDDVNLRIEYPEDGLQHMILNGVDVTADIRTPEISRCASDVSAHSFVRDFLLDTQRELARTHSVVMDGRDIGTVVLPRADVKIFLTASAEVRAKRRFLELQAMGQKTTYETVLSDMKQRDLQDSTRKIAPLRRAKDAVLLDSSNLTREQTSKKLREIVQEVIR